MKQSMRVISKLGEGKNKDLLLELPQELAAALNIRTDGTVNTMDLLSVFSTTFCQEQHCEMSSEELISLQERIELILNIYDSDRAAS